MKTRQFIVNLFIVVIATAAFAHGGHKHVIGTVESTSATTIVVKTSGGSASVPLSTETKYFRGSDTTHPATASEVENGMRVVVHLGADGKAAEVHIPETNSAEEVGVLEGKIVSRDASKNTLTVEHGAVKGIMGPMTMAYAVVGQKVSSLPKNET